MAIALLKRGALMVFRLSRDIIGARPGIEIVSANAIYLATIWAIPVIIAITFHEAAHGFVAHLLGDDTAWRLGRVSFNPLALFAGHDETWCWSLRQDRP